jgi:hypothetical protein
MNISSRVSEDGPNDSFAIATFSGIFGIISAGAVVMGAVTVFNNSTKLPDTPLPTVIIPACTEYDRAEIQVEDMPIGVSNADIGDRICFVRIMVEGGEDRVELRYR